MRTAPKLALSLILSSLLFAGLAFAAYGGLFSVLETRFYQPMAVKEFENRLSSVSDGLEAWHQSNEESFSLFMEADPVRRSLLPNQSSQDIFDRTNLAGDLMARINGLTGIRIIDAGDQTIPASEDKGVRRIHFSTFASDVLKKEEFQVSYELYGRNDGELAFSVIERKDQDPPLLVYDRDRDLFVYAFPFLDGYSTWRGTAVFYVTARSAVQALVGQNLVRLSDELALLSSADRSIQGAVLGMPRIGREIVEKSILERWARNDWTTDLVVTTQESGWILVSRPSARWGNLGEIVDEKLFTFPQAVKILFLAVCFLTIFLIVFLAFNLRQDPILVVRSRIRRLQGQLLQEIFQKTDEVRWDEIRENLSYRKHDVAGEIKKSFPRRIRKKHGKEIEAQFEQSWDEILAAIGRQEVRESARIDTTEIRLMLEQVLQNNAINLNLSGVARAPASRVSPPPADTQEAEEPEEFDEVEELTEAEEIAEAEEVFEVEELTETEEPAEAEEVLEVEELSEAKENAEEEEVLEVEELSETEEPEEIPEALNESDMSADMTKIGEIEELERDISFDSEADFFTIDMDLYGHQPDKDDFADEAVEADEVEYLEGEWEPELLEVATEDELEDFIETLEPDAVLIYDFESVFDHRESILADEDVALPENFSIAGPDFSSLDQEDEETAESVDYITAFIERSPLLDLPFYSGGPVFEFLETVGDSEPGELLPEEGEQREGPEAILASDGLYTVGLDAARLNTESLDPDFKELVDSVLH